MAKQQRNRVASANTRLIADKLWELQRALQSLTEEQLKAVDDDLTKLDGTNCWFWEKDMQGPMRRLVGYVMTEKANERRIAAEQFGIKFQ